MQQSRQLCITVQPVRVGAKLSTSKLPLGKVIDGQNAGKFSGPIWNRALHRESTRQNL